jgi:hypothetical protein
MTVLEVVSPNAQLRGDLATTHVSRRPERLEGRTVGLLWAGYTNGDIALKRVGEHLERRFQGLTTRFYKGRHPFNEAFLKEVSQECDAVVIATAD